MIAIALYIAAVWLAASLAVALLVGPFLRRNSDRYPTPGRSS